MKQTENLTVGGIQNMIQWKKIRERTLLKITTTDKNNLILREK